MMQAFVNNPYLDYGARMYDPDKRLSWTGPDPLAEKYYSISPYVFCANNPIKFLDPDGRDIWEIDQYGYIINRIEDKTRDAFYMVDDKGQRIEGKSLEFEYGTIESQKNYTYSPDGNATGAYDVYQVRGDENGTALFTFLSDHITGSESQVEVGQIMTGIEGKSGLNFITTSHTPKKEQGIMNLINGQLLNGYSIREINHSHPKNAYPSGILSGKGDIGVIRNISNYFHSKKMKSPKFNIYHVPTQKKIPYTPSSTITDF